MEKRPEISIFGSSQYLFGEDGKQIPSTTLEYNRWLGRHRLNEGEVDNFLLIVLRGGAFSLSGTVFRVSPLLEAGVEDPEGGFPFDFNLFLRQAEEGSRAYYCDQQLVGYRWHQGQARKNVDWLFNKKMIETFISQLERRSFSGAVERERRRLLSVSYRRYAYITHILDDNGTLHRNLLKAVRLCPYRWQVWAHLLLCTFAPFLIDRIWGKQIRAAQQLPLHRPELATMFQPTSDNYPNRIDSSELTHHEHHNEV